MLGGLCQLCLAAVGTPQHRLYWCTHPELSAARNKWLPLPIQELARSECTSGRTTAWVRALFTPPSPHSEPEETINTKFANAEISMMVCSPGHGLKDDDDVDERHPHPHRTPHHPLGSAIKRPLFSTRGKGGRGENDNAPPAASTPRRLDEMTMLRGDVAAVSAAARRSKSRSCELAVEVLGSHQTTQTRVPNLVRH